jgi:hypothetical protein
MQLFPVGQTLEPRTAADARRLDRFTNTAGAVVFARVTFLEPGAAAICKVARFARGEDPVIQW